MSAVSCLSTLTSAGMALKADSEAHSLARCVIRSESSGNQSSETCAREVAVTKKAWERERERREKGNGNGLLLRSGSRSRSCDYTGIRG